MDNHIIREYTHQDVNDIKECLVMLQDYEKLLDPHRLQGIEIAHEYLEHLLHLCENDKGKIFVVEIKGEVIGMVSVLIVEDKKHLRKTKRFAQISDMIIMPKYRGKGISKELLEKAEVYAKTKKVEYVEVRVLHKNPEESKNYLRNGFHEFEVVLRKHV